MFLVFESGPAYLWHSDRRSWTELTGNGCMVVVQVRTWIKGVVIMFLILQCFDILRALLVGREVPARAS